MFVSESYPTVVWLSQRIGFPPRGGVCRVLITTAVLLSCLFWQSLCDIQQTRHANTRVGKGLLPMRREHSLISSTRTARPSHMTPLPPPALALDSAKNPADAIVRTQYSPHACSLLYDFRRVAQHTGLGR